MLNKYISKTLWKYFLKELVPNFIFGFLVFMFVFFMTQIFRLSDLIVVHGVNIRDVTRLITFVILPFVGMTFPVALLFAVLITLGRMANDSELIALRAGGVSLHQILKPIITFSILVFFVSLTFTVFIESWGFRSFKKLVFDIGKSKISTGIQPGLFNEDFYDLVIYTDKIDKTNDTMERILLFDDRDKTRPLTVVARSGQVISDPESLLITLRLFDGNIMTREQSDKSYRKIDFETYDINITLSEEGGFSIGDPRALSTMGLIEKIEDRAEKKKKSKREVIELNKRFAIPLACIIFAIFSTALAGGTKNPRFSTGKGKAIVISMIVIVTYWLLSLMGQSYARKNFLPASIVMWVPNFIFLGISLFTFKISLKRT